MVWLRGMIYDDVKLQQVSTRESLAVSGRDKRRQIGCFPDRQGDNPASVCVNNNAPISPCPTMGLTPLSISRAPIIAHGAPLYLSKSARREVAPSAAGARQHGWQREETGWHMVAQPARVLLVPFTASVAQKIQTRSTILFVCAVNTAVLGARNPFKQD